MTDKLLLELLEEDIYKSYSSEFGIDCEIRHIVTDHCKCGNLNDNGAKIATEIMREVATQFRLNEIDEKIFSYIRINGKAVEENADEFIDGILSGKSRVERMRLLHRINLNFNYDKLKPILTRGKEDCSQKDIERAYTELYVNDSAFTEERLKEIAKSTFIACCNNSEQLNAAIYKSYKENPKKLLEETKNRSYRLLCILAAYVYVNNNGTITPKEAVYICRDTSQEMLGRICNDFDYAKQTEDSDDDFSLFIFVVIGVIGAILWAVTNNVAFCIGGLVLAVVAASAAERTPARQADSVKDELREKIRLSELEYDTAQEAPAFDEEEEYCEDDEFAYA